MTPKEKADQLLTRYINQWFAFGDYLSLAKAKQCALIAVDEILKLENNNGFYFDGTNVTSISFWQQVKQEIENL